jgi:hypothetical protein
MKFVTVILGIMVGTTVMASVPKGCPYTRACTEDANCKIYAFKHNCHGVCTQRKLKDMAANIIDCPAQCLCEQVTTVTG